MSWRADVGIWGGRVTPRDFPHQCGKSITTSQAGQLERKASRVVRSGSQILISFLSRRFSNGVWKCLACLLSAWHSPYRRMTQRHRGI